MLLAAAFLLTVATAAAALPSLGPSKFKARQWPIDCVPGHDFTVYDFNLTAPAKSNNGDQDEVRFSFWSKQTSIETVCRRNASSKAIYPVPGLAGRFRCDDATVEFIWDLEREANKGRLSLFEATCSEQTNKTAVAPLETSGGVDVELSCGDEDKDKDKDKAARKCGSKVDKIQGVYISYSNRPDSVWQIHGMVRAYAPRQI